MGAFDPSPFPIQHTQVYDCDPKRTVSNTNYTSCQHDPPNVHYNTTTRLLQHIHQQLLKQISTSNTHRRKQNNVLLHGSPLAPSPPAARPRTSRQLLWRNLCRCHSLQPKSTSAPQTQCNSLIQHACMCLQTGTHDLGNQIK